MHDLLTLIRNRWYRLGAEPRTGVSAEEIAAFERRHSVRLPASVRSFFEFTDGMTEGLTDEELIGFWSLSQLGNVPAVLSDFRGIPDYGTIAANLPGGQSYFVFADYSIWCHVYAVRLTDDSGQPADVIWICGAKWCSLYSSFEAFLHAYAELPLQVLFPIELQNAEFQRTLQERRSR
jgi:hypothetical protein